MLLRNSFRSYHTSAYSLLAINYLAVRNFIKDGHMNSAKHHFFQHPNSFDANLLISKRIFSKEESLQAYQILKENHMLNYFVIISLLSHHFESGEESTNKQRELLWNDLAEIMLTLEDGYVKKVNANTWDFMLIGFAKNGKIKIMLELLEIARRERVKLNGKTLSAVLNALANDSNIGKVEEIYYSMDDFGIIPDNVHFNILIKALIKVGEIEEALDRFKQNEEIIDSNTFILLLKGCADTKSINSGYQLYETIIHNRELYQNIQILSCLINMFTKFSDYKKSIELFQNLLNKNQVDTITWTTIITAYHKEERLEEIENLLTSNCVKATSVYNEILNMERKFLMG